MQDFPVERRENPSTEAQIGLLAYQVKALCVSQQEMEAKIDGLGDLLRQAVRQAEADKRELQSSIRESTRLSEATKADLRAHKTRAEPTLKTFETMGSVRKMFVFLLSSVVLLAAGIAALAQLLAFWKTQ